MWAPKKDTVAGHRKALRIVYNLDARFSVGWEKSNGCYWWWEKGAVFCGLRSAQQAEERTILSPMITFYFFIPLRAKGVGRKQN